MNDKFYEMARKQQTEKMTITTVSDALNEGGLTQWESMLAAYLAGDQTEAGRVLFEMIDAYIDELSEDEIPEIENQYLRDAAEDRADQMRENRLFDESRRAA